MINVTTTDTEESKTLAWVVFLAIFITAVALGQTQQMEKQSTPSSSNSDYQTTPSVSDNLDTGYETLIQQWDKRIAELKGACEREAGKLSKHRQLNRTVSRLERELSHARKHFELFKRATSDSAKASYRDRMDQSLARMEKSYKDVSYAE
ncbi:MAG: hypothetical protein HY537_15475 [Deltaproteobacteria bacterium]|nr:hypothetical protein [Deltaproteobacteria bacterium]